MDRRLFIGSVPAAGLVAALPAMAAASPARTIIADLIEAHHAAYAAYDSAVGRQGEIEDAARNISTPPLVRVLLWKRSDIADSSGQGSPVFAYSRDEIGRASKRMGTFSGGYHEPARIVWVEKRVAELSAMQHAFDQWETDAGITAAAQMAAELGKVERNARLNLMLIVPRRDEEGEAKRAYFAEAAPFVENWADDEFCDTLIALLCEVQS